MDFYMAPAGNSSRSLLPGYYNAPSSTAVSKGTASAAASKYSSSSVAAGSNFRQQQPNKQQQDKQQHTVTFQVYHEVNIIIQSCAAWIPDDFSSVYNFLHMWGWPLSALKRSAKGDSCVLLKPKILLSILTWSNQIILPPSIFITILSSWKHQTHIKILLMNYHLRNFIIRLEKINSLSCMVEQSCQISK